MLARTYAAVQDSCIEKDRGYSGKVYGYSVQSTEFLQTQPKSFIHREVYQYFEIDADPTGTYMGHVTGHEYVAGTGHQWQIKFPAIGNNQEHVCVYDENEMQNYCVAGDSDGVITATNIERLTDKIEDDYLSLDDFQLFVPKKSVSFTVACDGAGISKSDRRLYFNWLRDRFGYGPIHSNHPDAIKFDDPFLSDTSDKIDPRGPKFKPGTRFPKPAGPSWLAIKTEHSSLSNLGNSISNPSTPALVASVDSSREPNGAFSKKFLEQA